MQYNPQKHHRKSIRLKGYDYSQAGFYFITICTQNRARMFGDINNGKMILNDAGKMIEKWYYELENKFPDIKCHELIIMPNHIHFIIQNTGINVGADLCVCPNKTNDVPTSGAPANVSGAPANVLGAPANVLGAPANVSGEHTGSPLRHIIQWLKTMTTNEYIRGVKQNNWPPFNGKLWQRNYWEHIIRDENEYQRISQYIIDNPQKWKNDKLNGGDGNVVMETPTPYNEEPWMI